MSAALAPTAPPMRPIEVVVPLVTPLAAAAAAAADNDVVDVIDDADDCYGGRGCVLVARGGRDRCPPSAAALSVHGVHPGDLNSLSDC